MKKIVISLLLPILIGCTKNSEVKSDCKLVINSAYHIDQRKDTIITFVCSSDQKTLSSSVLKMKFTNPNLIEITCAQNSGYGGEDIRFQISRDLTISNVRFDYFDDNEGGKTETYKVEKFKVTLNKNPFNEGINGLQGEISIKGKIEVNSDKWFKSSFEEDLIYSSFIYCK